MDITTWQKQAGVTVEVKYDRGATDSDGWEHNAWTATITGPAGTFELNYRTGLGIVGEPEPADILWCVLADARTLEVEYGEPGVLNFEDWADNLGYSPDSRKAEKIWQACKAQTANLERVLANGADWADFLALEDDR